MSDPEQSLLDQEQKKLQTKEEEEEKEKEKEKQKNETQNEKETQKKDDDLETKEEEREKEKENKDNHEESDNQSDNESNDEDNNNNEEEGLIKPLKDNTNDSNQSHHADGDRCRVVQPHNEKGEVWRWVNIKDFFVLDQKMWFIMKKGVFSWIACIDLDSGLIDTEWKPLRIDEDLQSIAYRDHVIYFTDIRGGVRQIDLTSKERQKGGKLIAKYLFVHAPNEPTGKAHLWSFFIQFFGDKLLGVFEPPDHTTFLIDIYKQREGNHPPNVGSFWEKDYKSESGHPARINCLFVDDNRIWSGARDGSLAIWTENGQLVKIWNAHKGKRAVHCITTNKEFIFSGGSDKRIHKWTKDGEPVKRLHVGDHVYCIVFHPVSSIMFLGCGSGDVQVRDPIGRRLCILRSSKKYTVWDDDDDDEDDKARKKKEKAIEDQEKQKEKDKLKKRRKHVRSMQIIFRNNQYFLVVNQPNYTSLFVWDITGLESLPIAGAQDSVPIFTASTSPKKGPYIPEPMGCLIL